MSDLNQLNPDHQNQEQPVQAPQEATGLPASPPLPDQPAGSKAASPSSVDQEEKFKSSKRKTFLATEEPRILWQDRKRYLGMPISFTRYEVDETRFISRCGFFSTTTHETLLYRIMDLKMKRSLWQKIFGVGTITLYTADKSHSTLDLINVKHPEKLRRFLSKLVEEERDKRRLIGRELFGVAGAYSDIQDFDGGVF